MPKAGSVETTKNEIPQPFVLDGTVLAGLDTHRAIREEVRLSRIKFAFPEGFNEVDIFEQARIITSPRDFDAMCNFVMRLLANKPVRIFISGYDGAQDELCLFSITGWYSDLHKIDVLNKYPCLLAWLIEFIKLDMVGKVHEAHEKSIKAIPTKEETQEGDNRGDGFILERHFGDPLLFACYEFLHEMGTKPRNFLELFEFIKYSKVKNAVKEMAMASAKAGMDG